MQTAETPLKDLEILSPKVALDNLLSTIEATKQNIQALESRLKSLEDSADFSTIQSENIFSRLETERQSLAYYENQIPRLEESLAAYEKLAARDKSVATLEAVKPRLKELIANYNSAREQLVSAQMQISSLDRQLAKDIGRVNNLPGGSLFPFGDEFTPASKLPVISYKPLDNCPGIIFHTAR